MRMRFVYNPVIHNQPLEGDIGGGQMTEEARRELSETIDRIAALARKRHEIGKERDKIMDRTSVIRARLVIDIATAEDERGKRIYSNEQLRKAALTLRLNEDEEYQRLKEKLRELDYEAQSLAIEHNRLEDRKMLLAFEMGLISPPPSNSA
jgi:hypothetical protein